MKRPSRSRGWCARASPGKPAASRSKTKAATARLSGSRRIQAGVTNQRLNADFRPPRADLRRRLRLPDRVRTCKTAAVNYRVFSRTSADQRWLTKPHSRPEPKLDKLRRCENWTGYARKELRKSGPHRSDRG